jgi:hypothetical protein
VAAVRDRDDELRMANAEVARQSEPVRKMAVKLILICVQPLG